MLTKKIEEVIVKFDRYSKTKSPEDLEEALFFAQENFNGENEILKKVVENRWRKEEDNLLDSLNNIVDKSIWENDLFEIIEKLLMCSEKFIQYDSIKRKKIEELQNKVLKQTVAHIIKTKNFNRVLNYFKFRLDLGDKLEGFEKINEERKVLLIDELVNIFVKIDKAFVINNLRDFITYCDGK
ncbi:MAG: hypothetical protein ABSG42_01700 [Nitrospirota bacterium]